MMNRLYRCVIVALVALVLMPVMAEARSYGVREIPNVQLSDYRRFVSNPDGILSAEAVVELDAICLSLKERGIAEVVIVAVDDIYPRDMVGFSQELFEEWGVGDDELDNGLGILLVEDMHEIRFHTGYGLEGVLPDILCVRLQQEYMLPYFREGDYSKGMVAGMQAVDTLLSSGDLPIAEEDDTEALIGAFIIFTLCLLLPLLLLVIHEYQKTKCPSCGKHKLRVVERSVVRISPHCKRIIEKLVCDNCHMEHTRTTDQNDNSGPRRGGGIWIFPMGGGGSFGGGFGGGSFGGGGGGSRW